MIRPTSDASGTLAADRSRRLESKLQFDREAEQRGLGRLGARTQRPYNTRPDESPFHFDGDASFSLVVVDPI